MFAEQVITHDALSRLPKPGKSCSDCQYSILFPAARKGAVTKVTTLALPTDGPLFLQSQPLGELTNLNSAERSDIVQTDAGLLGTLRVTDG